jgi:hypothetical protein
MFRKIVFASIVVVLLLTSSIVPAFAQGTNPNISDHRWMTFQVAVNPTLDGFADDQAFGNAPVSFKNYLYDFVPEDIFTSQTAMKAIRSADGKHWESAGIPYPEDPRYNFVLGGFVYQGITGVPTIPGLVLRTANGKDWEKVFQAPGTDGATTETGQLGAFNGMLYVTTTLGHNDTGSAQIWRSRTGDKGTWKLATNNFGNNTTYTSMLTAFKGNAYFTGTDADGVHIWRSADGKNWNTVGQDLLNDPAYTNWYATNPVAFNGSLYVGTNPMVFAFAPASQYKGGQLYRSRDGLHWQMVLANGFGGTQSPSGIDGLIVYRDQLYALSNDLAPDGYSFGITYVWRSRTGNPGDWVKVNPDGMGANTCVGFSWEAIFKSELYIGNGFGLGETTDLMKMVNP